MLNLVIPSFFLSLFGIFTVFGITHSFLLNQLIYFVVAFVIFFIIKKIGRHFFQLNSTFFYWLFVFILIGTFFFGLEVKGSKRWIDLYFYKFQSSEFFKIFFILFMAQLLSLKHLKYHGFITFIKSFIYFLIPTLIIFKQPDLGNALVYVVIYISMIMFSDIPKQFLAYLSGICIFLFPFGWFILKQYQKDRLLSFVNPHLDTQGTAYNMIQAVITVGSGQFFGRGLGLGTQSRLFFLPENFTDFAYSSLIEQFGFIGGFVVIVLYVVIAIFLIKRLYKFYYQKTPEGKQNFLYIVGLLSYMLFQVMINIGMNIGLVPVAGIALPFISYGGSSVLAIMIGFALVP
ncbi:MAG: FtsW/RodA/SpoVE family cell cycle protein [bacterium]|nr:FtsW/RodA/SpoVE family cell cycle protein [bacterium]